MSDGNLITKDYQFQRSNTLYGCGANGVHLDLAHTIEGLGVPETKTQDVVYNFRDGSYPNPDHLQPRVLTIPCFIREATAAAAMNDLLALNADWVPLDLHIDLAFQLPGWGKFKVDGRPRGAKADLALMRFGVIHLLLRFDCLTPTIVDL